VTVASTLSIHQKYAFLYLYSNYRHCHHLIKKCFNPRLISYLRLRFVQSSRGDTTSGCALAAFVHRTSIRGSPPKLPPPDSCCPRLIPVALWRRPTPADSEALARRPPWDPWTPQRLFPPFRHGFGVETHRRERRRTRTPLLEDLMRVSNLGLMNAA
jgi:hypothetical protein